MTPDELLARIDQAAREGWTGTELDLRDEEIAELPPEIGRLTRLQKLAVGHDSNVSVRQEDRNPLTVLPPEIGRLTQLRELDLCGNRLTALPPEIDQLTNLQSLDLRENQLAALPPEIGKLTRLQRLAVGRTTRKHLWVFPENRNPLAALPPEISQLTQLREFDLSWNQLTTIPPEIGKLATLQSLDLRGNQLTAVPPEISQLDNLQSLDLRGNRLTAVPPEIGKLRSLQTLDLSNYHHEVGNRLTALPPEIGQLDNLQSLNLRYNQLTAVPPEIGQLSSLQWLSLSENQLTAVPPEISQLANLQSLDLQSNGLTALPPEIGQLRSLRWLNLDSNKLTILPPEIGKLRNLPTLHLQSNRLTALPPEIGQLSSLEWLNLNYNQLTAVPPEISQLDNLQSLDLQSNGLTALPLEIGQLSSLQWLNLSENQLTTVPPEIGKLSSLQELNLSENQLTTLPAALRQLPRLKELHLQGNPLPLPPELLGDRPNPGDPQIILDAYFQESRPLREAKLLLVGEGDVGKTAVINRLLHDRFSEERSKTVGVDIHPWDLRLTLDDLRLGAEKEQDAIRVNVWDFGGQEIYHATHQFFLTHRSLYLLILDATKDEAANRLDYWLRHIQSFAGDTPIILVVNKSDQHRLSLDERGLRLKYPSIRAIRHISCKSNAGIGELRQTIEQTLAQLPHLNDWIPLTWFAVKEKLAALNKETLPYDNYVEMCEAAGITHGAAQRTLARFLHDLGAALNFQDDRRLAGTHVLNPEWVTGGIYTILNDEELQGKGILRQTDLNRILDGRRYPHYKHKFLLDIMFKFELCAPLSDDQRYLIPGLLSKNRLDFIWPTDAPVALEYHYAILPVAVLHRLLVRLHHHTWHSIRWYNGVVLARDGCRALVIADPAAARLTIALDGPAPHRRHLLAIIRAELSEIHASFVQLEAEMWVPIPGHPGKAIEYDSLLYYEAEQIWTLPYPPIKGRIDVRQLLDGIESPAMRRTQQLQTRLRHLSPTELQQISLDLGINYEDLHAAINAQQPDKLMAYLERQDGSGSWLLAHIKQQPGGTTYIAKQINIQGETQMSADTFNLSGNFSRAILNIKSTLEDVSQTVNNMPNVESSERQALQTLIEQLQAELAKAPPELEKEADAVAQTAKALVDTVSAEQPNPTMVQITGEGLKKAAENIANVMPIVLTIATQIVAAIGRMVGIQP